jgi:hypothetical protein
MLPKLLTKLDVPCKEGVEYDDLKLPFGVLNKDPLPLLALPRNPCEQVPVVGRKIELLILPFAIFGGGIMEDALCCDVCGPRRAAYSGSIRDRDGDGNVNLADLLDFAEDGSESCDAISTEGVECTDDVGEAATVDCAVAGVIGVCLDTSLCVEGDACDFFIGS